MGKNKVSIDGALELNQVTAYLEDLLNGLKAGKVHIQLGDESVSLAPSSIVDCEIEVSQKKEKEKISIQLSWKKDASSKENVKISATGPRVEIS